MSDLIYIRVLQHDTEDNIRIGMTFPTVDIDATVDAVKANYEKEMGWCGGFEKACKEYWKRVALVNAETLEIVKVIYQR
ncbi:hypothetical protein SAMN05216357_11079 [Porphyromonadaceae bacterium KH3CP3RA]|nr:hypothetical protein SAMN05216357_11079 [Porphyromonadaceae bacterium KH3CP3RA]